MNKKKEYMTRAELVNFMKDCSRDGFTQIWAKLPGINVLGLGVLPEDERMPCLDASVDDEESSDKIEVQEFEVKGKWVRVKVRHGQGKAMPYAHKHKG